MYCPSPYPRHGLPLGILAMRPQRPMAAHHHDHVELVLIESGSGRHVAAGQELPLLAGDVFVIPPGMPHGYRHTRSLHLVNICFDPQRLALPLAALQGLPGYQRLFAIEPRLRRLYGFAGHLHLDPDQAAALGALCGRISGELQRAKAGHEILAVTHLQELLVLVCRYAGGRASPHGTDDLATLLAWIDEQLERPITVEVLAARAHCSAATLQRRFRAQLGCPVLQWLAGRRLARAQDLLRHGQLPMAQIARHVGLQDANYFSRWFRQRTGQAPGAWRAGQTAVSPAATGR